MKTETIAARIERLIERYQRRVGHVPEEVWVSAQGMREVEASCFSSEWDGWGQHMTIACFGVPVRVHESVKGCAVLVIPSG